MNEKKSKSRLVFLGESSINSPVLLLDVFKSFLVYRPRRSKQPQTIMFRYIVICGCLMAIAQAGIINGGIIGGLPLQQTLTIRPSGPALALPAIATDPRLTTLTAGPALVSNVGLSSGLGLRGVAINGYGIGSNIGVY